MKYSSFCLLLIGLLFFGTSCKKGSDADVADTYYYVRFKIDGVQKEYKLHTDARFNKTMDGRLYNINGSAMLNPFMSSIPTDQFDFSIENPTSANAGTYTNIDTGDGATSGSFTVWGAKGENDGWPYKTAYSVLGSEYKKDASITITEVGNNYIKGTFQGTVYPVGANGFRMPGKDVSGKFYLQAFFGS